MEFDEIHNALKGIPFITETNARYIYNLVLTNDIADILELGFAHGTATCYMAAALRKRGGGRVVAVDLQDADFSPTAEDQISKFGFGDIVELHRMRTGYNWYLHSAIVQNTSNGVCLPVFDLCIIDGPKNWTIDSSAFFLADKLLRDGGWIVFDDYLWTYAEADSRRDATDGVSHRSLSEEELQTPHIREIFELLVKQHPDYGRLLVRPESDWAIAQKIKTSKKNYSIEYDHRLCDTFTRYARGIKRRIWPPRTSR